jgi:hypothetical protein
LDAKNGRCGIRQGGLGLVAGKEYIGYAIVRHAGKPAPVEVCLAGGPQEADGQSVPISIRRIRGNGFALAYRFPGGAAPSPKTTIWRTTRRGLDQPFEKPQQVAGIAGFFESPTLTHDGKTMHFHKLEKDRFVIYCMKR